MVLQFPYIFPYSFIYHFCFIWLPSFTFLFCRTVLYTYQHSIASIIWIPLLWTLSKFSVLFEMWSERFVFPKLENRGLTLQRAVVEASCCKTSWKERWGKWRGSSRVVLSKLLEGSFLFPVALLSKAFCLETRVPGQYVLNYSWTVYQYSAFLTPISCLVHQSLSKGIWREKLSHTPGFWPWRTQGAARALPAGKARPPT